MKSFLFLMAFSFLILSCAGDTAEKLLDKCNDIKCSDHGDCAIDINNNTVCICNEGYHADALECIANEVIVNPCDGESCSDNGSCAVAVNNVAVCICDLGFHADGLTCVADAGSPCEGVSSCDTNGACAVNSNNEAVCVCNTGFHAGGLTCIADEVVVNPCESIISCDTNGICAVNSDNEAVCACNTGYHADNTNLTCVRNSTDPCEGITCDGDNNSCINGECQCDSGYNDDTTAGTCVINTCGADNHSIEIIRGDFYDFVESYDYLTVDIMDDNHKYVTPPDNYVTEFKLAVKFLIKGEICSAEEHANNADMEVFKYIDTNANISLDIDIFTNEYICIRGKDEENDITHDPSYYRGLFCMRNYIETNTYTRQLHISIPHPLYDGNTNIQGVEVFENSGARYFSLATAHRCANNTDTGCDGVTSACDGHYKISDAAHNSDSLFYYFTTQVQDLDDVYHLQLHGIAEQSGSPNLVAITSVGAPNLELKSDRMIRKFTDLFTTLIGIEDSDKDVVSCNDGSGHDTYCAGTNTEGRYINGSINNSCQNNGVSFAHSKFIHVEQTRWLRGGGANNYEPKYYIVTDTTKQLFPAVLVLESTE